MYDATAVLVGLLAIFVPPVIAGVVWLRRAPRRASGGTLGAGLLGFVLGVLGLSLAWIGKQLALMAGLHDLLADTSTPMLFARSAIGAGLLAAVVEETIRFGIASAFFRRVRGATPLLAGALFGLGWGWIEAAGVATSSIASLGTAESAGIHPPAWLPAIGLIERTSAIALHVALTALAVAAAIALFSPDRAARSPRRALALFAAALTAHALLDAAVRALSLPAMRAIDALAWNRAGAWFAAMELVFGLGSFSALLLVRRLPRAPVVNAPPEATSPAS